VKTAPILLIAPSRNRIEQYSEYIENLGLWPNAYEGITAHGCSSTAMESKMYGRKLIVILAPEATKSFQCDSAYRAVCYRIASSVWPYNGEDVPTPTLAYMDKVDASYIVANFY
jgi:hypothetical protein